ncbi:MAG TPA: MFS transporter, partial [Steroidobacteraceae bacterium]
MVESRSVGACGAKATEGAVLLWAAAAATSFFTLAPTLVGALIDHLHLSVRELGLIASCELAGSTLGSAIALLYGRRFSAQVALTVSLALAGIFNLATAAAHDFQTIASCRVAAGLGGGLAFSVVNAAATRARQPGHWFAAISVVQMMFGVAGFLGVPLLTSTLGLPAVFMFLGVCCLAGSIAAAFSISPAPVHDSPLRATLCLTPRGALLLISLFATYLT